MKTALRTLILFFLVPYAFGQTVTNGSFSLGTYGWGCSPEVNNTAVYGGSSHLNNVAEVDAEAQLCQTISGFVPGASYRLLFQASRRTNCGPTVQSINVWVSNVLSGTVTRNATGFALTQESFTFTASSSTHTLAFSTNIPGTCNMLVDNIQIQLVSGLPVELTDFFARAKDNKTVLGWTTASETLNDFYTLERSADAQSWETIAIVKGAGSTFQQTDYDFIDEQPLAGTSYYRLSQTDFDGTVERLGIVAVKHEQTTEMTAYPNPATDRISVTGIGEEATIVITDAMGRRMPVAITAVAGGETTFDITELPAGSYLLQTASGYVRFVKG